MQDDIYYVLGADPGKHGAVFLLPADRNAWKDKCIYVPFTKDKDGGMDAVALYNKLAPLSCNILAAFKEYVHAVAGNSASSMFSFGESNGILKSVLSLVSANCPNGGFPIHEVSPAKWQKTAWEDGDIVQGTAMVDKKTGLIKRDKAGKLMFKSDPKGTSANAAHRIFAETGVSFVPKGCRAEHDGVIDAALIAYHGFVASGF